MKFKTKHVIRNNIYCAINIVSKKGKEIQENLKPKYTILFEINLGLLKKIKDP